MTQPAVSTLTNLRLCRSVLRTTRVLPIIALFVVAAEPAGGRAPASPTSQAPPTVNHLPWLTPRMGSLDEFAAVSPLPSTSDSARFVLGDSHGFVHVYEQRGKAFQEVWVSEFLESAVGGIFVRDVDADGLAEIVLFTEEGRLHHLDAADYRTLWSNPPDEYARLTAMIIRDIDDDEQQEFILCADGHLVVYDGRDHFEEWRSDQADLNTVEIVIDDVDGDESDEIVLNDGFVFDARFLDLEWQSPVAFGLRIASLVDDDGIPEIIGELTGNRLRIFDVDLRRKKSARQ